MSCRSSVIQKINVLDASREELLQEHIRQTHIRDFHQRYVSCLGDMRSELARDYAQTKTTCPLTRFRTLRQLVRNTLQSYQDVLTTKRNEFQILMRGDFDLLESYDCDLEKVGKGSRRIESVSFLDVDKQLDRRLEVMRQEDTRDAMTTPDLRKTIRSLQLKNIQLQEQFRELCSVFQQLATQYTSCEKYNIAQRYVALKCIIKIAFKSDL